MKRSRPIGSEGQAPGTRVTRTRSNDRVLPSPGLVEAVRRQRDFLQSAARDEFDYVIERVGAAVPEVCNHAYFPRLLGEWYSGRTLDMPPGWFAEIEADCRRFFAEPPWPQMADRETIPLTRCRELLATGSAELSDAHVRFLRDQLCAFAEVVVNEVLGGTT